MSIDDRLVSHPLAADTILAVARQRSSRVGTRGFSCDQLDTLSWTDDGTDRGNWIGFPSWCTADEARSHVRFLEDTRNCLAVLPGDRKLTATVQFSGRGNMAILGNSTLWDGRIFVSFRGHGNLFFLGDGCGVNDVGCNHTGDAVSITIGDDCLFSTDILIRTHDEHGIVDMQTGKGLNPPASVLIEPHVWIGRGATIRQGVRVGFGSIVGEGAVVTGDVPRFSAVAGVPARLVREGVSWTLEAAVTESSLAMLRAAAARLEC